VVEEYKLEFAVTEKGEITTYSQGFAFLNIG